jgi:hypothetical protein
METGVPLVFPEGAGIGDESEPQPAAISAATAVSRAIRRRMSNSFAGYDGNLVASDDPSFSRANRPVRPSGRGHSLTSSHRRFLLA